MTKGYSKDFRKEIIEAGKHIYEKGLVSGTAGNISCRLSESRFLITASNTCLGQLKLDELVLVDEKGKPTEVTSQRSQPSSETGTHLAIYEVRSDINAVVHTHSIYASALAYARIHLKPVNPESFYILGDVPLIPYFKFGSIELAQAIKEKIGDYRALLLQEHGVITIGKDLWEAVYIAELVEEVAKISYLVELLEKR